ncbi:CoA-binding protein [Candidatus Beckwithbacteria bacterium]|nr:CoA-binding protein [Candidatus Beckwithbacteria bacterium]
MEITNLDQLFNPQSIAVIGASTKEKTVGNDIAKNLATGGFTGKVFLVNPNADELFGLKVYHDISEINENIDLLIICIPAQFVPQVIAQTAKNNVKAVAVISAGFKEAGNYELETELVRVCKQNNIALIGPNCLGVINPQIKLNASFAALMPAAGNVAFISQSGALCTSVIDYARNMKIGFSKFISIGNKADVDELGLIEYLSSDPDTKVILIYAESLNNSQRLIELCKKVTKGTNPKPIIILKSGKTQAGASAIASHTGSLSSGDSAYQALFSQAGIIRANSISELFNYAQIFSKNTLKKMDNVAIVTNAGGPGVVTTDEVVENGMNLAKISEETEAKLKQNLPPAANTHNPIDLLGDAKADRYEIALQNLVLDQNVDGIIVVLTPQSMSEIEATAQAIIKVKQTTDKPITVCFMGKESVASGVNLLQQNNVATTEFPEAAAKSLATLGKFVNQSQISNNEYFYFDDINKEKVRQIFDTARQNGQNSFPESQALEIFQAYNFPLLKSKQAHNADEVQNIADEFNCNMAMKIVSPDILHKSDVGGVILNINKDNIRQKFAEIMTTVSQHKPEAKLEGVLLMEMAPENGVEVILGANKDPMLGSMIMFGLGGIYVEVFKDVVFGIAPITRQDAQKMLQSIKSKKIFDGVRGKAEMDKEKIIECLGRLSCLLADFPEITELDINPLMVLPKGEGVRVLDGRIVIK